MFCRNLLLILCLLMSVASFAETYPETDWESLMPPGWEPEIPDVYTNESEFDFNDVPTPEQQMQMQTQLAPVVEDLNNKKLRIPGYVIPIKYEADMAILEFLLVPYMGACIHVPPPPSNQMVYVVLDEPLVTGELWDPVWVKGLMKTENAETEYATAGYRLVNASVEKYEY